MCRPIFLFVLLLLVALPVRGGGQNAIDNVCFLGGAFGWSGLCSTEAEWTAGWYVYHHGFWWTWDNLHHLRPAMMDKPQPAAQIEGMSNMTAEVADKQPGQPSAINNQGCITGQSGQNSQELGGGANAGYQVKVEIDANGCLTKTVTKNGKDVLSVWVGRNLNCVSDEALLNAAETGSGIPLC